LHDVIYVIYHSSVSLSFIACHYAYLIFLSFRLSFADLIASFLKRNLIERAKLRQSVNQEINQTINQATPCRPLVVVGPSGVGKGTLLTKLFSHYPHIFGKKVSHTTRAPRQGEVHSKDYYFVSIEEFESGIERGEFIEYARVHKNIYGTTIESVKTIAESGRVCVLELDVQGVEKVLESTLKPHYCFIAPPSFESLSERLTGRGSETPETLAVRLETAKKELQFAEERAHIWDFKVVNDEFDQCYHEFLSQLETLYPNFKEVRSAAQIPN
jgi:guanylate kinase